MPTANTCKRPLFGERILPEACVLSTTIGLANTSRIRGLMADHGFKLVAEPIENVRFTSVVYPGDTIKVESEILDAFQQRTETLRRSFEGCDPAADRRGRPRSRLRSTFKNSWTERAFSA